MVVHLLKEGKEVGGNLKSLAFAMSKPGFIFYKLMILPKGDSYAEE